MGRRRRSVKALTRAAPPRFPWVPRDAQFTRQASRSRCYLVGVLGRLFLLFTIVPVVELYLLISIGKVVGGLATVALVLASGLVGALLARREGSRVIRSWQAATERGEMPKDGVVSSLLVLAAGVLLITPGVLTDVTGILLLVPPLRRRVAEILKRALERRFRIEAIGGPGMMFGMDDMPFSRDGVDLPGGDVIDATAVEVDVERESDSENDAPRSSGRAAPPSLSS
jgi:UPF0716 protein FxsA